MVLYRKFNHSYLPTTINFISIFIIKRIAIFQILLIRLRSGIRIWRFLISFQTRIRTTQLSKNFQWRKIKLLIWIYFLKCTYLFFQFVFKLSKCDLILQELSLLCHYSTPKPNSNSLEPELFHRLRLHNTGHSHSHCCGAVPFWPGSGSS